MVGYIVTDCFSEAIIRKLRSLVLDSKQDEVWKSWVTEVHTLVGVFERLGGCCITHSRSSVKVWGQC